MDFFRRQNWDIVRYTWLWFAISGVVIAIGLGGWIIHGLNFGIDFTGGSLLRYKFERALVTEPGEVREVDAKTREVLAKHGLETSLIQVAGTDELYIRTPAVANDEEARKQDEQIRAGLSQVFSEKGEIEQLGRETVGPVIGSAPLSFKASRRGPSPPPQVGAPSLLRHAASSIPRISAPEYPSSSNFEIACGTCAPNV